MNQDVKKAKFDIREYLLDKYGSRMTKRDVIFESRKSRATIDNARRTGHPRFCARLKRAEIGERGNTGTGSRVLFQTVAIAAWLDADG